MLNSNYGRCGQVATNYSTSHLGEVEAMYQSICHPLIVVSSRCM